MISTLPKEMVFPPQDREDVAKGRRAALSPSGYYCDFRWHDYTLSVDDGDGVGELSFGEHGAIVDCRHFEKSDGPYGGMSVAAFRRRFGGIVERLVPQDVFDRYLAALNTGTEGIFVGADKGGKSMLRAWPGNEDGRLQDLRLLYLTRERGDVFP